MSLAGKWRITQMDLWDREAIDLVGPAFIEFGDGRSGRFRFITVDGCHHGDDSGFRAIPFDEQDKPSSGASAKAKRGVR